MESFKQFRQRILSIQEEIGLDVFSYDESEFWMVQSPYEYIEFYALDNNLINTAIALPLARGMHNGTHRKSTITKHGKTYRVPYVIHPLMVCRMLLDIQIPISKEEEDILLAAALCHDMIEDIPFPDHGKELYTRFHLDKRVYDTVKLLSKRKDFTEEEEKAFFHEIETHPLALLIKLSDRGNNVEDLYNMSNWKVHEYVDETRKFFFPMCDYGIEHFPEIHSSLVILGDKIRCLTETSEILVDRYHALEAELLSELEALQKENEQLRQEWKELWDN